MAARGSLRLRLLHLENAAQAVNRRAVARDQPRECTLPTIDPDEADA